MRYLRPFRDSKGRLDTGSMGIRMVDYIPRECVALISVLIFWGRE
jgi:hypothetical protein